VAVVALVFAIGRPLLFATLAPDVAAARGVPTRALGVCFLALLGVVAAEATQAVGALLLLGLLAAPAAAAHRVTGKPFAGVALAGLFAVVAMVAGLVLAYSLPWLPPSTAVVAVAVAIYGLSAVRR
jgi:zinc/manganese transport system permease protein